MNTPRRTDFLVGLTVFLGVAGLAAILILFGEISLDSDPTYPVTLQLDEATGLEQGARVTLNGVPIGAVDSLDTADDPRQGVLVALRIDEDQQIPRAIDINITSDLVGNTTLGLKTLPPGEGAPGYIQPEETVVAEANDIIDRIANILDERFNGVSDSLANIGTTADSVTRLADTYTRVGEKFELVLDPDNADPDNPTSDDANLFRTLTKIERSVDAANEWLDDPAIREQFDTTVADAQQTLQNVRDAADDFREATQNISQRADGLAEDADLAVNAFVNSARNLDAALEEAQTLIAAVNAGEGTAGLLATNPDLYRNINDASVRLETMLEEFELLLRTYRTEGIDIDL